MFDRSAQRSPNETKSTSLPHLVHDLAPGEYAEVEQSSWGAFRSTDSTVSTGGLGPCCGIVVYDPNSQLASVGHIACLSVEHALVEEMIGFIKSTSPEPASLAVTIAGLAPIEGGVRSEEEAEQLRKQIVERFVDLGVRAESIRTEWAGEDTALTVDIELNTGEVRISSIDLSEEPDLFI